MRIQPVKSKDHKPINHNSPSAMTNRLEPEKRNKKGNGAHNGVCQLIYATDTYNIMT